MRPALVLFAAVFAFYLIGCDVENYSDNHTGPLLVDFEDDVDYEVIRDIESRLGIDLEPTSVLFSKTKLMSVADNGSLDDSSLIKHLLESEYAEYIQHIELSQTYHVTPMNNSMPSLYSEADNYVTESYPNDPLYREGKQWNMTSIGVEKAWEITKGQKVVVAVLDTGISNGDGKYPRVPDLRNTCMVKGRNFTSDGAEDDPYDMHGHGTHVGGTIAQSTNNGIGVVGVAPEACLMPVKVLSDQGYGSTEDIAEAIIWATDNGAKVINLSLGGGGFSAILANAVKYAADKGVFLACAAGNNGTARIEYPAAHDGCNAVSSVGKSGNLAYYSSYGTNGSGIFVAAPGGDKRADGEQGGIWQNTIVENSPKKHGYFPFQGTSMATPHVAGVAALAFAANQNATLDQVKEAMRQSATDKGDREKYGHGIVSAAGTVEAIKGVESCDDSGLSFLFGLLSVSLLVSGLFAKRSARRMIL